MMYDIPVAHNGKSHELAQGTDQFAGPKPAIYIYIYFWVANYHLINKMRECETTNIPFSDYMQRTFLLFCITNRIHLLSSYLNKITIETQGYANKLHGCMDCRFRISIRNVFGCFQHLYPCNSECPLNSEGQNKTSQKGKKN